MGRIVRPRCTRESEKKWLYRDYAQLQKYLCAEQSGCDRTTSAIEAQFKVLKREP